VPVKRLTEHNFGNLSKKIEIDVESKSSGSSIDSDENDTNPITMQIQMTRHSVINAHKSKLKEIVIHHTKELIYTCGADKRISLSALGEHR
jgi:hypothetical protein